MRESASTFLTDEEKTRIEDAVREAEKRTEGEIVVMVVAESHHYPLSGMIGGILFGTAASLSAALFSGYDSMWHFLGFFVPSFALCSEIVKRWMPLKKLFVSRSDMEEEVEEAAIGSFFKNRVYETGNHTGILIYISLFEHRVRILADKGISSRVDQSRWDAITALITQGIKEKKQASALCGAIQRCGELLEEVFPASEDNTNEISDSVLIGRSLKGDGS